METISFQSRHAFALEPIRERLSKRWSIDLSPGDTVTIHGDGTRAYLHPGPAETEAGNFCLLLDYWDVEFAKSLIEIITDDDPDITIDNDFGTVLSGREFVARMRTNPTWAWK